MRKVDVYQAIEDTTLEYLRLNGPTPLDILADTIYNALRPSYPLITRQFVLTEIIWLESEGKIRIEGGIVHAEA